MLSRKARLRASPISLSFAGRGSSAENREKFGGHSHIRVLLQADREVAEAYKVYGTPAMVVVRPNGAIGSAAAVGAAAIMDLLSRTAAQVVITAIPVERSGDGLSRAANIDAATRP